MANPHLPGVPGGSRAAWVDLVRALVELRDALTGMSLLLNDYRFEHDVEQQQVAAQQAQELAEKIKSRAAPPGGTG